MSGATPGRASPALNHPPKPKSTIKKALGREEMTPKRPKEKPAREKLSKLEPAPKDIHKALPDINPSLCAPLINTSDYDSPSRDTKAKGFTALAINEEGANALNWEQARRDLRLTTRATPFRLLVLALDQMCARKPLRTTYTLVHRAHGGRTQLKFLISEKKSSSFTQAKSLRALNSVENAYCEFELLEEKHKWTVNDGYMAAVSEILAQYLEHIPPPITSTPPGSSAWSIKRQLLCCAIREVVPENEQSPIFEGSISWINSSNEPGYKLNLSVPLSPPLAVKEGSEEVQAISGPKSGPLNLYVPPAIPQCLDLVLSPLVDVPVSDEAKGKVTAEQLHLAKYVVGQCCTVGVDPDALEIFARNILSQFSRKEGGHHRPSPRGPFEGERMVVRDIKSGLFTPSPAVKKIFKGLPAIKLKRSSLPRYFLITESAHIRFFETGNILEAWEDACCRADAINDLGSEVVSNPCWCADEDKADTCHACTRCWLPWPCSMLQPIDIRGNFFERMCPSCYDSIAAEESELASKPSSGSNPLVYSLREDEIKARDEAHKAEEVSKTEASIIERERQQALHRLTSTQPKGTEAEIDSDFGSMNLEEDRPINHGIIHSRPTSSTQAEDKKRQVAEGTDLRIASSIHEALAGPRSQLKQHAMSIDALMAQMNGLQDASALKNEAEVFKRETFEACKKLQQETAEACMDLTRNAQTLSQETVEFCTKLKKDAEAFKEGESFRRVTLETRTELEQKAKVLKDEASSFKRETLEACARLKQETSDACAKLKQDAETFRNEGLNMKQEAELLKNEAESFRQEAFQASTKLKHNAEAFKNEGLNIRQEAENLRKERRMADEKLAAELVALDAEERELEEQAAIQEAERARQDAEMAAERANQDEEQQRQREDHRRHRMALLEEKCTKE